ncbi:transcriptional repressor [Pelagibius sp.]|uniref:transcriptional repressor n=1 Tax=Pelagibius sp. TaxID=1931238 RepID=UPI003B508366
MTTAKLTRNQQLVLDRLAASPAALSAYELLDQLRDAGLRAPVQVYRALETLGQKGLVHRIESLNAYVACCAHDHQAAAGFAICDDCGEVTEFAFPASEKGLKSVAGETGFETRHMTVELHGRCAACASH